MSAMTLGEDRVVLEAVPLRILRHAVATICHLCSLGATLWKGEWQGRCMISSTARTKILIAPPLALPLSPISFSRRPTRTASPPFGIVGRTAGRTNTTRCGQSGRTLLIMTPRRDLNHCCRIAPCCKGLDGRMLLTSGLTRQTRRATIGTLTGRLSTPATGDVE